MPSKKVIKRKKQKEGKLPIPPRGHQRGVKLTESHKSAIQTTQILKRLNKFVLDEEGEVEMAPHKVTAAGILLKKVMPDLQSTHNTSETEKSHDDWVNEIEAGISEGTTKK